MKLRDILREIEDEEGGDQKQLRASYDVGIQPDSIEDALKALDDVKNYGIYSKNLTDRSNIEKIFGPPNPNQKEGAAKKDWASLDVIAKKGKIQDIIKRNPSNWSNIKSKLEIEDDKQAIKKLSSMSFEEIKPTGIFGSKSVEYYPTKTADNMKEYAGKLEKGTHYKVDGDKIIFPRESSPFNPKSYLKKVLKTIMDNANVSFGFIDVEREEDTTRDTPQNIKPKAPTVPPLSTTVNTADQADKLKKLMQARLGDVQTAKYEVESVGTGAERQYKLVVTGISADQRAKLQPIAFEFKQNLKEELDWERRQWLVRAGIIK
jgi:flavodoxin